MTKATDKEGDERIIKLFNSGITPLEIADRFGISHPTVLRRIRSSPDSIKRKMRNGAWVGNKENG